MEIEAYPLLFEEHSRKYTEELEETPSGARPSPRPKLLRTNSMSIFTRFLPSNSTVNLQQAVDLMNLDNIEENRFLFVVYGVVTFQLSLTLVFCSLSMFCHPFYEFSLHAGAPLNWTIFFLAVFCMILMYRYRTKHPWTWVLLLLFTTFMCLILGETCAYLDWNGWGHFVFITILTATSVFFGITLYCFFAKGDFDFQYCFYYSTAASFFIFAGLSWTMKHVFGFTVNIFVRAIGLCSIVFFIGFILYDTTLIIVRYGLGDPLLTALELYLDIIGLFLAAIAFVLNTFSKLSDIRPYLRRQGSRSVSVSLLEEEI